MTGSTGGRAAVPAAQPSADFRVEIVTRACAPVLAALQAQCFDEAWSAESIERLFDTLGAFALIGSTAQGPAAFALGRIVAGECEILAIGVVGSHRRRGHGATILAALSAWAAASGAERVVLEVATDNAAARALYAAQGFVEVGRRRNYYERAGAPPVDGLILAQAV